MLFFLLFAYPFDFVLFLPSYIFVLALVYNYTLYLTTLYLVICFVFCRFLGLKKISAQGKYRGKYSVNIFFLK